MIKLTPLVSESKVIAPKVHSTDKALELASDIFGDGVNLSRFAAAIHTRDNTDKATKILEKGLKGKLSAEEANEKGAGLNLGAELTVKLDDVSIVAHKQRNGNWVVELENSFIVTDESKVTKFVKALSGGEAITAEAGEVNPATPHVRDTPLAEADLLKFLTNILPSGEHDLADHITYMVLAGNDQEREEACDAAYEYLLDVIQYEN